MSGVVVPAGSQCCCCSEGKGVAASELSLAPRRREIGRKDAMRGSCDFVGAKQCSYVAKSL